MTARTILTALLGLALGMHLRLQEPRQLADTAEHALGWVCRMTYNDSGGAVMRKASIAENERAWDRATNDSPIRRFSARPAVTFFLRMLGLPRLRASKPVELRP